mmetsp:Transcript_44535/g.93449  ORF Transcript_44535/g.93449 Transcript_44535/m.93449 type:complete len:422 (+) Transcript_44535:127-1392(+)
MQVDKLDCFTWDHFDLVALHNNITSVSKWLLDFQLRCVKIFMVAFLFLVLRVFLVLVSFCDIAFVNVFVFFTVVGDPVLFGVKISFEKWNGVRLKNICRIMIQINPTHQLNGVGVGICCLLVHCSKRGLRVAIEYFCSDVTLLTIICLGFFRPHSEVIVIVFNGYWFPMFYMLVPCLLPLLTVINEHLFSRLDIPQSNKLQHQSRLPLLFQKRHRLLQPFLVMYPWSIGRPTNFGIVLGRMMIKIRHIRTVRKEQHGRFGMSKHVIDNDLLFDHAGLVPHDISLGSDPFFVHVRGRPVSNVYQGGGSDQSPLGDESRRKSTSSGMGNARLSRHNVVDALSVFLEIFHGSDGALVFNHLNVSMNCAYCMFVVFGQSLSFTGRIRKGFDDLPQVPLRIVVQGHFVFHEIVGIVAAHEELSVFL